MLFYWLFCIKHERFFSTSDACMEGWFEWNEDQPIWVQLILAPLGMPK